MSHDWVSKFEARGTRLSPRRDFHRAGKIRAAFEAAGIEFIAENGGGAGVRFRKPCRMTHIRSPQFHGRSRFRVRVQPRRSGGQAVCLGDLRRGRRPQRAPVS